MNSYEVKKIGIKMKERKTKRSVR